MLLVKHHVFRFLMALNFCSHQYRNSENYCKIGCPLPCFFHFLLQQVHSITLYHSNTLLHHLVKTKKWVL